MATTPRATLPNLTLTTLLLLVLTACGAPSTDPPTGSTGPVTTTIDRTGGTLEARGEDGTRLRLTIPPNATAEPLQITITPLPPGTSTARFDLQPFGLRLRLPIEYRLTLPEPAPTGATLFLSSENARAPTDTQLSADRRTLTTTTPQLGYPTNALTTAHLRPLDDDQPATGQVEADPITCAGAITFLNQARKPDREGWLFTVTEADILLNARLAVIQACTTPDDLVAVIAETELLQEAACRRLLDATTDALTLYTPALGANIDDLWTYLEALLVHAATVDITGATCPTRPELETTLDTLIHRYADAYPTRIANLDTDIWRLVWSTELRNLDKLLSAAQYFALPDTTQARLRNLTGDLLDTLHPRAYERCRDENTQGYLADLLNGGGHLGRPIWPIPDEYRGTITADDLKRDIQHCTNTLTITAFDELAEPIAGRSYTLGARTPPDRPLTAVSLQLPTDGALQISGQLRPLRCEAYRQTPRFSNDTIALHLDGTEVARWNHTNANYLNQTRDIALNEILEAAGLPEDATGIFTLTLSRQGEACNGTYGDTDTELYRIELVIDAGTIAWGAAQLLAVAAGSIGVSCFASGISERDDQRLTDLPPTARTVAASVAGDLEGTEPDTGGTCNAGVQVSATASLDVADDTASVRLLGTSSASGGLTTSVIGEAQAGGFAEAGSEISTLFTVDGTVAYVFTYAASAGGGAMSGGWSSVRLVRIAGTGEPPVIHEFAAPIGASVGGTIEGVLTSGTYQVAAGGGLQTYACSEGGEVDVCGSDPPANQASTSASFTLELRGALLPWEGDGGDSADP